MNRTIDRIGTLIRYPVPGYGGRPYSVRRMPTDLDDYVGKADPTVGGTGKLREQDTLTDHGGYYYNGDQEEYDLPVTSGYLQEEQVIIR